MYEVVGFLCMAVVSSVFGYASAVFGSPFKWVWFVLTTAYLAGALWAATTTPEAP